MKLSSKNNDRRNALELKVKEFMARGLLRRAGTMCLELIDLAETDAQRQRYAALRGQCLRSASSTNTSSQSWYLSGNFVG